MVWRVRQTLQYVLCKCWCHPLCDWKTIQIPFFLVNFFQICYTTATIYKKCYLWVKHKVAEFARPSVDVTAKLSNLFVNFFQGFNKSLISTLQYSTILIMCYDERINFCVKGSVCTSWSVNWKDCNWCGSNNIGALKWNANIDSVYNHKNWGMQTYLIELKLTGNIQFWGSSRS